MARIASGINVDVAYDKTPERALYCQIMKNPEYEVDGAEYVGDKPGFMHVKENEFDLHDWDQYDRADQGSRPSSKDDPPGIRKKYRHDLAADPRLQLVIENVWTKLKLRNPPKSVKDRAYVNYFFFLQHRESEVNGSTAVEILPGDHIWKCEKKGSKLIDR